MKIVINAVLAVYIVLFSIFSTINIGIVIYFVYSQWYLKKDVLHTDSPIQTIC